MNNLVCTPTYHRLVVTLRATELRRLNTGLAVSCLGTLFTADAGANEIKAATGIKTDYNFQSKTN